MYADRHAARGQRPISLTAAALLTGGIMSALMFVQPVLGPVEIFGPLTTVHIPIDPPPPPKPDEVKPKQQVRTADPKLVLPKPEVPLGLDRPTVDFVDPGPPQPPVENMGGGTAVTVEPAPPPLFVEPAIDSRYQRDFQPPYPSSEIRAGREGVAAVRVLIGADGRVKAVEKVRATSDAFFDATRRQALARWRFKPATRGGVPEESWKVMTVRFVLES